MSMDHIAGHHDPCNRCSHRGSYHGQTFCAYKNSSTSPMCDCKGWQWKQVEIIGTKQTQVKIFRPQPRIRRKK